MMRQNLSENQNLFLFIGGLHRSGTTALNTLLGTDSRISVFSNTGVTEDEGQYLQTVLPLEKEFGAVGEFALDPRAHMTEGSPYLQAAQERLFTEWANYWDLSRKVLVEKTPSNIIRMRLLREVFPQSVFIIMTRHPIATILAATKWRDLPVEVMLDNWLAAHTLMQEDMDVVGKENCLVVKYEEFTHQPEIIVSGFERLLGFAPIVNCDQIQKGLNDKYFERWRSGEVHLWKTNSGVKNFLKSKINTLKFKGIAKVYEPKINRFGYSFDEVYQD